MDRSGALYLLLLLIPAVGQNIKMMGADVLDQLVQLFVGKAASWEIVLQAIALDIFVALAGIEITLAVGRAIISRGDMLDMFAVVVQQMITVGFFFWVLRNWPHFSIAITDTFGKAGSEASKAAGGDVGMSPTALFLAGCNLAYSAWQGMSWSQPGMSILLAISGIVVVGIFAYIAAAIVEILIESAIVAYAGVLMMAFGPNVYTRDFAIAQFRYAMSVGMKRFMMQLIAGIGASLVMDWSNAAKAGTGPLSWQVIAMMIGAPIVLLRLTQTIPAMAQGMIMGTHIGSHGSLASTAASVGRMAVAASAAATGAGVALTAAARMANVQLAQDGARSVSRGELPRGRISQAAMFTGNAARNLGAAVASDVGSRLTGSYGATHGHLGYRAAAAIDRQRTDATNKSNGGRRQ
jgi:type IV secretion system protein TrbL